MTDEKFNELTQKIFKIIHDEMPEDGGFMMILGDEENCSVAVDGDYDVIKDGLRHQLSVDEDFMIVTERALDDASKVCHPAPEWFEDEPSHNPEDYE